MGLADCRRHIGMIMAGRLFVVYPILSTTCIIQFFHCSVTFVESIGSAMSECGRLHTQVVDLLVSTWSEKYA